MKIPTKKNTMTEIDHEQCGILIRAYREKRGMKLKDLAKDMGMTSSYLSDLERGKRNWYEALFNQASEIVGIK